MIIIPIILSKEEIEAFNEAVWDALSNPPWFFLISIFVMAIISTLVWYFIIIGPDRYGAIGVSVILGMFSGLAGVMILEMISGLFWICYSLYIRLLVRWRQRK